MNYNHGRGDGKACFTLYKQDFSLLLFSDCSSRHDNLTQETKRFPKGIYRAVREINSDFFQIVHLEYAKYSSSFRASNLFIETNRPHAPLPRCLTHGKPQRAIVEAFLIES
jgi:hypothetical protein